MHNHARLKTLKISSHDFPKIVSGHNILYRDELFPSAPAHAAGTLLPPIIQPADVVTDGHCVGFLAAMVHHPRLLLFHPDFITEGRRETLAVAEGATLSILAQGLAEVGGGGGGGCTGNAGA